jgi:hypothetical protein
MNLTNLTSTQLRQAADLKEKIAGLEKQLDHLLGSKVVKAAPKPAKKKGDMSVAGKARVAAAQKARWAKIKAGKPAVKPVAKKKGTISAEGIARIKAAQKARWAKIHAEKSAKK